MIPTSRLPSHSSKFYLIPKVLDISVTTYERKIDPLVDIFLYQSQSDVWCLVRGVAMATTYKLMSSLCNDIPLRNGLIMKGKDLTVFYIIVLV